MDNPQYPLKVDLKNLFFGHTPLVLADQAMVSGVNFLVGILLARLLGVAGYGRFVLAFSAVLFLNSIQMALILSPMMVIGAKKDQNEKAAYFGAVFMQQICFVFFSILLILGGGFILVQLVPKWQVGNLLLPLAAAAVGFQTQEFFRRYCFTQIQARAAIMIDGIYYGGQILILALIASYGKLTPVVALWGIAGAASIAILAGLVGIRGKLAFDVPVFKNTVKQHWDFGKWLGGSAVLQWFSGQLFIYVSAACLSAAAAGAIKAAQNIVGITHILFLGMENFVPIKASRIYHINGNKALKQYLKKVALWGGAATGTICLIAAIAPRLWMELLYGASYIEYAYIVWWYAGIYMLIFFSRPLTAGLKAIEHTRPTFTAYIVSSLFSVATAVTLVRLYNIEGALFGILCTQMIMFSIFLISFLKLVKTK
jgi:O-antigen/teichoic acid export membrane protein